MYNFSAFGTNIKLLDFEVRRSNVKVTTRPYIVKKVEANAAIFQLEPVKRRFLTATINQTRLSVAEH